MIDNVYSQLKKKAEEIVAWARNELRQIRTGKASPSLVEDIVVSAYGGQSTLKLRETATITVDGPSLILIHPFDPSIIQDIEKAIRTSPLQLSPAVDGHTIRISTPPLTEEQRISYTKIVNQKIEDGKNNLRNERDDARKTIKMLLDEKDITEDDKYRAEKEIDEITKKYTADLDDLKKKKQEEIMHI